MEIINNKNVFTAKTNELDNINNINVDNVINNYRDNDNISYIYSNTDNLSRDICKYDNNNERNKNCQNNEYNINIYRYKFTNEFTEELYKFSKIHQYDHRNDFKEAWNKWIEENCYIIDEEIRRLTNLGYDGNIIDKMFKSARYYFRKKSTEKKAPSKRRCYIGVQKEFLEAIDNHINENINTENFKPSEGFDDFCKKNTELLKQEVFTLYRAGMTNSDEIKNKIKKTYKNRYFLIISK
jgi:hypothetical protein